MDFWTVFCVLNSSLPVSVAPCWLQGSIAPPWFMCWFPCYINCLFVCLLNFLPHFLPSLLSSFLMLSFLLIYFLTGLLSDLSTYFFRNRSRSIFTPEVVGGDQTWLQFLWFIFYCIIFCCGCMFVWVPAVWFSSKFMWSEISLSCYVQLFRSNL